MFKNYGDRDFFEEGILIEQQSPSQFTLLRCNPIPDQENRYEFARLDVDLDDDWMDKQALRDYAGLEPGVDDPACLPWPLPVTIPGRISVPGVAVGTLDRTMTGGP